MVVVPGSTDGPTGPVGASGSPSPRMTWTWRFEKADGRPVATLAVAATGFPSQSDAESWLGEVWRDLLEDGVEQVTLLEGDREVYGPMSLRA